MHDPVAEELDALTDIASWVRHRLASRDETFPALSSLEPLPEITASGVGMASAWATTRDQLIPSALPTDNPRYLAFVGGSPTVAAVLADMAISAAGIYAGSELEAGAVVAAERAAIRWLADLVGLPAQAHGTFVSGGSAANLSALVAARHGRRTTLGRRPERILAGDSAHVSINAAADVMGCEVQTAGDRFGRLDGAALQRLLRTNDPDDVVAVVAAAGATNTGAVDALDEISQLCAERGIWLHVDAAYGGAALLSDRARPQFSGIENADSVTIDPHKWLFTPFDCAAVIYRDPGPAKQAHAQSASYLDIVANGQHDNPSDYGIGLTRRARGLPFWVSLVANGTDAYRAAVEQSLDLARECVDRIQNHGTLAIVGIPSLSVVLFARQGWSSADYYEWSAEAMAKGIGLVTPTVCNGETVLRLCIVNPLTTIADIDFILSAIA